MKKAIYIIIGLLVIAGIVWLIMAPGKPGKLDTFAQCLKDKGATFYGAFWCPHCQKQKERFGASVKYLPYVECSTPDGQGQTQVCKDAGITTYPTWQFGQSTSTRVIGEMELADLASTTGCVLSQ
ncbi:MAG: hypothetical protein WCK48_03230 [bacterium]